jgi:hypothetical protein
MLDIVFLNILLVTLAVNIVIIVFFSDKTEENSTLEPNLNMVEQELSITEEINFHIDNLKDLSVNFPLEFSDINNCDRSRNIVVVVMGDSCYCKIILSKFIPFPNVSFEWCITPDVSQILDFWENSDSLLIYQQVYLKHHTMSFSHDEIMEEAVQKIKDMYVKRKNRLFKMINDAEQVYFVRHKTINDTPDGMIGDKKLMYSRIPLIFPDAKNIHIHVCNTMIEYSNWCENLYETVLNYPLKFIANTNEGNG